ncbi:MAG: DegT/DnrJ/EryC1/StrS family aminotransferase, partial [Acutalibacteraceae bacterium]
MNKRKEFLSYSYPYWDEKEIDAVVDAIRSNWWSRGPKVSEFENKFAEYIGVKYAVAVNSCTAATHLALIVCGVGEGDEVIVPTMTFCSTANVVVHTGAKPVLCDVMPENGLINPDLIEGLITEKTKAIIPVHYAGRACDMDKINAIAKKHGLYVIEDCAHAIGTRYNGKIIGDSDNICCYSFYATKNIATGEGGMLTCNNEELAERARKLSVHGMSKN